MARSIFGGALTDVSVALVSGFLKPTGPITLSLWSAETGGVPVTDLLLGGQPVTAIRVGSEGDIPAFEGPDGVSQLWVKIPGRSARRLLAAAGKPGTPGADGQPGPAGPSGGPFPSLAGVGAGQVAQTTGGGGVEFVSLSGVVGALVGYAVDPFQLADGAITRNASGAATGFAVAWPDGATGAYVGTPSASFPSAVDSYTVTHVLGGVTTTYTQPAVTRDAMGQVTNRPKVTVA